MDSPLSAYAVYKKIQANHPKTHKKKRANKKLRKDLKKSSNYLKPKQNGVPPKKSKLKKISNSSFQKTKSGGKKQNHFLVQKCNEGKDEPPKLVPISKKSAVRKRQKIQSTVSLIGDKESTQTSSQTSSKIEKELFLKVGTKFQKFDPKVIKQDHNPVLKSLSVFKWLVAPIQPKLFFERYWEKEVLYIQRNEGTYFDNILSTNDLDDILRNYPLHYTRNIDVVSYENGIKEVHNQEGRAVPSVLWDYYSNGCSIRVLNPHTYNERVHILISTLQEYFGTMVGTNVYLTPPGSQGFAPHYDDIEAFIVQLEGRKHWKLYKPKGSDVLARDSSPNFKPEDLDDPFMEVVLNAGDLLYFPRGTIHEGRTDLDAHSLHITVSVYQHTAYVDLLENILPITLKKAAENNIEFRKGMPLDYLKHVGCINKDVDTAKRRNVISKVKELIESLGNYVDVDLAADLLGRKFMHDAMPPMMSFEEARCSSKYDGDYMKDGKVLNRVEIDLETKVRLLRYHCLRVVSDNESQMKLYYCTDNAKVYHGEEEQWLEIDSKMLPGLKMLQNKFPEYIEVEQLPIDDEIAKLQLVADLWERGLIVTSEPLLSVSEEEEDEQDTSSV